MIQEAYIQGVSTRSVDQLVQAMGMTGISKSQVSRLCEEIDGRVQTLLNRPWKATGRMSGWTTPPSRSRGRSHHLQGHHHRGGRQHRRKA